MVRRAVVLMAVTLAVASGCSDDNDETDGDGGQAGATGGGDSGGTEGFAGTSSGAGSGGTGTGGCSTAPYSNVFRFLGSSPGGWSINRLSKPVSLVPEISASGEMTGTLLEVDSAEGNPAAGSLKFTIPFHDIEQELIVQQVFTGAGVDLRGAALSAMVRLDSLANGAPDSTVRAQLAMKSVLGLYTYAAGPIVDLEMDRWVTVTMSADAAPDMNPSFDNCAILEVDVLISTASSGTYGTAVVHVDTIAIVDSDEGVPPEPEGPDGGAGAAGQAGAAG